MPGSTFLVTKIGKERIGHLTKFKKKKENSSHSSMLRETALVSLQLLYDCGDRLNEFSLGKTISARTETMHQLDFCSLNCLGREKKCIRTERSN